MPDELRIQVLGPLVVVRGGQPLPESAWRSRQERRLLGVLLAARGRRVSAEQLMEWLWPDASPGAAATTLRSAVSALRHMLEPMSGRASSHYILTRAGGYAWNNDSGAQIDAELFLDLLDRQPTAPPMIERALALYAGDYLADEPDAPWAEQLRDGLRERFLSALYELAIQRIDTGAYDAAIALARRGLAHDRLREPLYRVLMRAQARAGDVAAALQTYERCRRVLDEELGVVPSAQTRELHTAILRDETAPPRKPAERVALATDAASTPAAAAEGLSTAPFVGRAAELAALRGWLAALEQRRGGVVAVMGEAGIGKTRLVTQALAGMRGSLMIAVRCTPLERGLPFAPLSEALRPLLRAAPIEQLRALPPVALAQVAELLPVVRERLPDLLALPSAPPGEGQNYLLDGIVDVALALAQEQPLIVWCDDAQWADEATLAVLGRLARRAPRRALLIILAYRSEELVENAALHQLLRTLGRNTLLRPLLLGRLEEQEVATLLALLANTGTGQVSQLAQRLRAASSGNPLVLSVALQSLLESNRAASLAALLPTLDAATPLPDLASAPALRELVLARLEHLPASARALLEQLAVIGRPCSLDLIEQLDGAAGLEAAQTLIARQYLIEDSDGRLQFGHDLLRSIISAALLSPQRRLLHRSAAEAIAALHSDNPAHAAELSFHFEQAGRADAEVLHYATQAGDHARRSFGYRAALSHYDTALRAAERLGSRAPTEAVRRAFVGRLLMAEALLDWEGVLATATRFDQWRGIQPAQLPLLPPRRLAILRALMGDLAGAAALGSVHARSQQGMPTALDDLEWRTALIFQPIEAPPFARHKDSRAHLAETSAPWLTPLPPDHSSPVWPSFLPVAHLPGNPATELPAALGAEAAALALFQVGWAALLQGLLNDAEPCLLRAYELAIETSQAAVAVISALQLAHLHDLRGDSAATTHWMNTSLDMAQRAPESAWAAIWPQIHQGFLLLLDDQFAVARTRFELLAAQLRDLPTFQSHRAGVEVGLGLLDLAGGNLARAEVRLQAALAQPQLLYGFVYVAAQHGLARIAAQRGNVDAARAWLAHALDYSARRRLLPEYIRTAIEVARIERDFGVPARALPLLRNAAALAAAAEFGPLVAAARALLARLEAQQ